MLQIALAAKNDKIISIHIIQVKILWKKDSIIKTCMDENKAFMILSHFKNEYNYGGTPYSLVQNFYLSVGYVHSSLDLPNSEK